MNTETTKNHRKPLAIITAAVIVGTVIFTSIIEPQLKKHTIGLERMGQLQLKLTKMQSDLFMKDRIDNIYSQIEPLITGRGSDQQEISLFTRQLSNVYSKLNLKIRSVKILPCTNEAFYRNLSIKIEMSGHIKDVCNFIHAVEIHSSPIRIEQFDLKAQEITDNVRVTFMISKVVTEPGNKG